MENGPVESSWVFPARKWGIFPVRYVKLLEGSVSKNQNRWRMAAMGFGWYGTCCNSFHDMDRVSGPWAWNFLWWISEELSMMIFLNCSEVSRCLKTLRTAMHVLVELSDPWVLWDCTGNDGNPWVPGGTWSFQLVDFVRTYIYIYIYNHIYIYIIIYIYMCVYIYIYIYMCVCVWCVYICVHVNNQWTKRKTEAHTHEWQRPYDSTPFGQHLSQSRVIRFIQPDLGWNVP